MDFNALKKNKSVNTEKLKAQIEDDEAPQNTFETDPDDWYPGVDKAGNGYAVIRFLPVPHDEESDYVKWVSHSFQNADTELWYIENSLKTISEKTPDPVGELNKKLWNSSKDEEDAAHKQAKDQKRKVNYRANILVIVDSANPENNGKIKKFKFGKTIFDFIKNALTPPEIENVPSEPSMNPFDMWEGANFKINIFSEKKGSKTYRNYSRSAFQAPSPLAVDKAGKVDEKKLKEIWDELNSDAKWSLHQYIAEDKFKTYDELKARLDTVLGYDSKTGKPLETTAEAPKQVTSTDKPKGGKPATKVAEKTADPEEDEFQSFLESQTE